MTDSPTNLIESLFERVEAYSKTTLELTKLRVLDRLIFVMTTLIARLSFAVMLLFFALLFNVGIALFLGEYLGKIYFGFFIVAGFYLVAAIICQLFLFDWIRKPMHDLIIKKSLQPTHDAP